MDTPNFKNRDFVHLHLHSDYSLLQSTIQLKQLSERLKELDQKACALTDLGNLFGAISMYTTMRYAGIKPILGYEAYLTPADMSEKSANVPLGERQYYNVVLLAKNNVGFENLVYIASKAYTDGFYHKPRIDFDLLEKKSEGLICLSGGKSGPLRHYLRNKNIEKAEESALRFQSIFGKENFYFEIQPHGMTEASSTFDELVNLARRLDIPLVAANESKYIDREDAKAHEILMCVGDGRTYSQQSGLTMGSDEYYVRSTEEMWDIFGDKYPDALENTVKIAEQCDVEIDLSSHHSPFPTRRLLLMRTWNRLSAKVSSIEHPQFLKG
jgi:DNA polymerase-3 subunit alpha